MSSKPDAPQPTSQERSLAEIGAKQWNDYQQRYVPLENQYVDQIQALPQKADELAGIAGADAWQSFQAPPTTAKYGQVVDAYLDQEKGLAAALPRSAQAAQDAQVAGLTKMTAYGRGLADSSVSSMYQLGQTQTQLALQNAKSDQASTDAWMGGAGLAAGALSNSLIYGQSPTSGITPSTLPNSRQGWVY